MTEWFGEPWPSGICYTEDDRLIEEKRTAFPVGESCLLCGEQFDEAAGDAGVAMPWLGHGTRHVHKECMFMNVAGPLAHHEGRCQSHGDGAGTGMTLRQEALEVWRRHQEGKLFGRSRRDRERGHD